MEKHNSIAPFHDPTVDDHPSREGIFNFGNHRGPSLLGFNQFQESPGPIWNNAQLPQVPDASLSNANMGFNQFPDQKVSDVNMGFNPFPEVVPGPSSGTAKIGFNEFPEVAGQSLCNNNVSSNNRSNINNGVLFPQASDGGVGGAEEAFWDADDPLFDPFMLNDLFNDSADIGEGNFGGGSSNSGGNNYDIPQGPDFGNPVQIPACRVLPSPYTCSACHTLREIVHTNGVHITNLEIHGRLGTITHAILDKYDFEFTSQNHVYEMYDFSKESIITVKNFLLQYYESRKWEGYFVLPDRLSAFYQALSVGIDEIEDHNSFPQPTPMDADAAAGNDEQMPPPQEDLASQENAKAAENDVKKNAGDDRKRNARQEGDGGKGGRGKSSLALQRERTSKMKLKDFSDCFDLSINEAAQRMEVCATVIKKKCREAGIRRWPYRKIKGIKRKIAVKRECLKTATAGESIRILAEIQVLEQQLANIFKGLTGAITAKKKE